MYGPYAAGAGTWYLGSVVGPLSAGTHTFSIQSGDNSGNVATPYADSFTVLAPTSPTISSVVVVDAKTNSSTLQSGVPTEITWAVYGAASVSTESLSVDGKAVTPIYGPYAAGANTWYCGGMVGSLTAGAHTFTIQSANGNGKAAIPYAGSFTVLAPTGPTISNVVVIDAKTNSSALQSGDQTEITWAVNGAASVSNKLLNVDGKAVTTMYGPYAAGANTWYLGGVVGPLAAGTHTFSIQSVDGNGKAATPYVGSFTVLGPAGPTISSVVVVDAKTNSGILDLGDPTEITWAVGGAASVGNKSLSVDGKAVTTMYGPYAAGANRWYLGGAVGPLAAGTHTFTIQSVDANGNAATPYTGSFNIVSALLVDASAAPSGLAAPLVESQLQPIVAEAERRWAAADGAQVLAAMSGVTVEVADLPSGMLGEEVGKTILIDRTAAGYGWFVDPTPADDSEFADAVGPYSLAAVNGGPAANRVDLLTAVMHEMGHELGFGHSSSPDVMYPTLPLGTRRLIDL
jgi:hypothetical protein